MRKIRPLVALAAVAVLSACVTSTPYQAANKRGEGYADQKLEAGKFRVVFEGNSYTDRAIAENYVLFRAAELTLLSGGDYFVLVDSNADTRSVFNTTGFNGGGVGLGNGFFYGGGFGGFGGFGGGLVSTTTRERLSYTVGAVITTGRGPKPDNPMAFDARSVIESIGPSLQRPKA